MKFQFFPIWKKEQQGGGYTGKPTIPLQYAKDCGRDTRRVL